MKLHYHPVSSYSQKVAMGLLEKAVPHTLSVVNVFSPGWKEDFRAINPFGKIPALELQDGTMILESSNILEYVDNHAPTGVALLPEDRELARQARYLERVADLYLNDPMQKIFFDGRKPEAQRDPAGVAAAKVQLDHAYRLLERHLSGKTWMLGDAFSVADCAAAPALFYLERVYPYEAYPNLAGYAGRVIKRNSYLKVLEVAGPYLARM